MQHINRSQKYKNKHIIYPRGPLLVIKAWLGSYLVWFGWMYNDMIDIFDHFFDPFWSVFLPSQSDFDKNLIRSLIVIVLYTQGPGPEKKGYVNVLNCPGPWFLSTHVFYSLERFLCDVFFCWSFAIPTHCIIIRSQIFREMLLKKHFSSHNYRVFMCGLLC